MNRKLINLTFVLLMALFSSCAVEEVLEMPGLEKESMLVNFSLDMNLPTEATKADNHTWGDNSNLNDDDNYPEVIGDAFENQIKTDQLLVFAYKPDGTFVGHLPILKAGVSATGEVNFTCALKYSVHEQSGTDQYKIMVFANCIDKSYGFMYKQDGAPDVDAQKYSTPVDNIPMWGVHSFELVYDGSVLRKQQDIGEISLLRATSKIGVRLSEDLQKEGFRIKAGSIKLNYVRANGFSAPKNWENAVETKSVKHADAFNPTSNLALDKDVEANTIGMNTNSYYLYVPETLNNDPDFTPTDGAPGELALSISVEKVDETGAVIETYEFPYEKGIKFRKYVDGLPEGECFDIVRNHFYDYQITKINTTIKLELIEYTTLPWIEKEVQIGDNTKYLVLNTDLVKIYSKNVDATSLKFISSSPIKRVELKDVYNHDVRGDKFAKGTDNVNAYYVGKYGKKTQLGEDPGFNITDKVHVLDREKVILKNISSVAEQNVLQGCITITSPFMADPENDLDELKDDSHFDTIRYLEFEVENEQGLTETFRVEQYPPLTITNIEGYFSYRQDFRISDMPLYYVQNEFKANTLGSFAPFDNGEPCHWLNPTVPFFVIADYYPYHVHEWDIEKGRFKSDPSGPHPEGLPVHGTCPSTGKTYDGFEEMTHGLMEREYLRVDQYKDGWKDGVFHRSHYYYDDGSHFVGSDINNPSKYYQNIGPIYSADVEVTETDPDTGEVTTKTVTKYYRRHYSGNSFNYFFSLVVTDYLPDGRVTLKAHAPSTNPVTKNEWAIYGSFKTVNNANHRMYHIRTNATSSKYSVGRPKMETVDGRTYTAEGVANSRMVSPSFMIASQLGTTEVPVNRDKYVVPKAPGMYPLAQHHCEQYAEAYFEDEDGDGRYDEGENVVHLTDWRLPTKAEIELIAEYQSNSRAIDLLLTGKTYFCASTVPGVFTNETILSEEIPDATLAGYYIRCVRDVYEDKENKNLKQLTLTPLLK